MLPDHYQALGVNPQASHDEVRAAYLRLMRAHHPDRRPGDERSAERALRANGAWEVLGDRARRASYDRLLANAVPGRTGVRHVSATAPSPRRPAYSAEGSRYRRAFHVACLKVGAALTATGLVLLLAVA
jgi:curved DNA-binding protein CbpA